MTNDKDTRQEAIQFLIAEYNELSQDTRRLRQEGTNRLNFLVTITSSLLTVLAFFSQGQPSADFFFQAVSIAILLLLVLIGLDTFNTIIGRDINTDRNVRATGRIRLFFSKQSPEIRDYLTWRCHDEPTSWVTKNNSTIRKTVQYILSLNCALIVSLLLNLAGSNSAISVISGVIVFVGAFNSFQAYAMRRFKSALLKAQETIRFPKDPDYANEGK